MVAFPVLKATGPLPADTLPAVQVSHYWGRRPHIYTLARLAVHNEALHLSLLAFERAPQPGSVVAFALAAAQQPGSFLFLELSPGAVSVRLFPASAASQALPPQGGRLLALPAAPGRFGGVDEQGWFWGANLLLPEDLLAHAHIPLGSGQVFWGALYKYNLARPGAWGCSRQAEAEAPPFSSAALAPFVVTA